MQVCTGELSVFHNTAIRRELDASTEVSATVEPAANSRRVADGLGCLCHRFPCCFHTPYIMTAIGIKLRRRSGRFESAAARR